MRFSEVQSPSSRLPNRIVFILTTSFPRMRTVQVVAEYPSRAHRLGTLIRPLLCPFVGLYLLLFSLLPVFLWPFIYVQMLATRRRSTAWHERMRHFLNRWARGCAYLFLVSDEWDSRGVEARVAYTSVVPRFEMLFRPLYLVMAYFNFFVLAPFACALFGLQWLHILIFAKRQSKLQRLLAAYLTFFIQLKSYEYLDTDERPPLVPDGVNAILSSKGIRSLDD